MGGGKRKYNQLVHLKQKQSLKTLPKIEEEKKEQPKQEDVLALWGMLNKKKEK